MEEIDTYSNVADSYERIKNFVRKTPIYHSEDLNNFLDNHKIYFKLESFQNSFSYKIRGILNNILYLKEKGELPSEIVTYSTGNHAFALAVACRKFNIKNKIFLPKNISPLKYNQTVKMADQVIVTQTREEAEKLAREAAIEKDSLLISPSNGNLTITGNGTVCFESLKEREYDAIFVPCGGGGLLAGSYFAIKELDSSSLIYGAEPSLANDIIISLKQNSIYRFKDSPKTIADGARTLGITQKIFDIIKLTSGIYEIEEEKISYWCCWIMHLLKIICEPTSALSMAASVKWLADQKEKKEVLVIITGSNIDQSTQKLLWSKNHLETIPKLKF